jgi:plasmid maintenance system antidote protein VapI
MPIKNSEFEKFLGLTASQSAAAESISCKESLVSAIRNGRREVSKGLAKTIVDKHPQIDLYSLLFPSDQAA